MTPIVLLAWIFGSITWFVTNAAAPLTAMGDLAGSRSSSESWGPSWTGMGCVGLVVDMNACIVGLNAHGLGATLALTMAGTGALVNGSLLAGAWQTTRTK